MDTLSDVLVLFDVFGSFGHTICVVDDSDSVC